MHARKRSGGWWMGLLIGVVSQKGGVGKSTLARIIAREYAAGGWNVKIADLDLSQSTSFKWQSRRLNNGADPQVAVEQFASVADARKVAGHYDLVIFDGAPHATAATLEVARVSHFLILPTGLALDDLEPTVRLAHELTKNRVDAGKIAIALLKVGDSAAELEEARDYIKRAGYYVLPGGIPERTAYRRAFDLGRTLTETPFRSLNQRAEELAQAIINRIDKLTELQGAA